MINIRRSVFETNSSSTHSISIIKNQEKFYKRIPRNSSAEYKVEEYGDIGSSDDYYAENEHYDEVDKLRYIINMIASFYEYDDDDWDYSRKNDDEYVNECFDKLLRRNLFIWLKEVVKEETGTNIKIVQPYSRYYPFFEITWSDDINIKQLFKIEDDNDEEAFKKRIKEIIFDKDIIIINKNVPYGMEDY
jgi:hypothetical protein